LLKESAGLEPKDDLDDSPEKRFKMKIQFMVVLGVMFVAFGLVAPAMGADSTLPTPPEGGYLYVAPNVFQSKANGVFTTFALTNTTPFWFNPHIYLIDADGAVVKEFAPLLKGFGTWQKTTVEFVSEDFQGSIWVVSPQPIVSTAFIHQLRDDGTLTLLGSTELRKLDDAGAASAVQHLSGN